VEAQIPAPRPHSAQQVAPASDVVSTPVERAGGIGRAVYGTIVVTSVLVVYDGWANLRVGDAVAIILGPVVAMVIAHVFAASLAAYPRLVRRPTGRELLRIVRHESRFLLVCVPQIVLLLVLTLVGLRLSDAVRVLIWSGAASLGFWGGLAARRAGLRWRGVAVGVITGLAAGGAVLVLQVFLEPGKAISNGVAAIQFPQRPVA
jgi:hypothetical protein